MLFRRHVVPLQPIPIFLLSLVETVTSYDAGFGFMYRSNNTTPAIAYLLTNLKARAYQMLKSMGISNTFVSF